MNSTFNAFDEIDNPEAAKKREEILAEPDLPWVKYSEDQEAWYAHCQQSLSKAQARQEQEVIAQRELIEKFAEMLKVANANIEELEKFAQENDIPGICGWSGFECWRYVDPVENALQWAASDHSC